MMIFLITAESSATNAFMPMFFSDIQIRVSTDRETTLQNLRS
jgi:hypothetical protein